MDLKTLIKESKGLIFDFDGTLVDSVSLWENVDVNFFHSRGMEVPETYQDEIVHLSFRDMAELTCRKYCPDVTPDHVIEIWLEMAEKEYADNIVTIDGVEEFLFLMKKEGKRMALATANRESLYKPCLTRNGIDGYFDLFSDVNTLQTSKNDPLVYLTCTKHFGLRPEECVVFEDILIGINTAKSVGFKTIGVLSGYSKEKENEMMAAADFCIRDYKELL